jgi:hypothetical protein
VQTPDAALNLRIADARSKVIQRFWRKTGGEWKVAGIRKEACRIALVLLRAYPRPLTQGEISHETDLHSGSVSRILTGARGEYTSYFENHGNTWQFSDEGVYWMIEKVVPGLLLGKIKD